MEKPADKKPKIVLLDAHTLNPGDLSYDALRELGTVTVYPETSPDEVVGRLEGAEVTLVNKQVLTGAMIGQLPRLRCIVVTATGYNNVDLEAASEHGIPVCNAVGYGSDAVAQHAMALLLELTNHVGLHADSVQRGHWSGQQHFTYQLEPMVELAGKTLGIYGFGNIGQRMADIALAFGMKVIATHKHPKRDARPGVRFVDIDILFRESDAITLHAPLTEDNAEIVNRDLLKTMKPSAFLINTARGGLIREADLREALDKGWLAGAALDVLSEEPPPADHVLFGMKNCLITPHQAWGAREARQRLLQISVDNVAAYLKGEPQNVVNAPA